MKQSRHAAAVAAIMTLFLLSGCGSWLNFFARGSQDQYRAAEKAYRAGGRDYKDDGDGIAKAVAQCLATPTLCNLTDEQRTRFQTIQSAERTANAKVAKLLLAWDAMGRSRGTKPAQMDAAINTLDDARTQMNLLAMEVPKKP